MIGVVSAVDTLASQAFGMKQYSRVGIIAQRACLITLVLSGLVLLLWWNVYPLLVFCGQPPSVALQASIFLRCLSLGLFPLTIYEISKKYLQVQVSGRNSHFSVGERGELIFTKAAVR